MPDGWYDEELLAALGEAVKARQAVPEWFVETGKNAYAWHNVDAELARLTYDSDGDAGRGVAAVRSEAASIRALTFTSARLSIELQVAADSLVGQIIPPRAGTLEVHTTSDPGQPVPATVPHGRRDRRADRVDHHVSLRFMRRPGSPATWRWRAGPDHR
jgi:hypothetical protein